MNVGFEQSVHVLCVGTPEQVKGLQWALAQFNERAEEQFKVYRGVLSDLNQQVAEYDFVVMLLDLGQPVPVTTLRDIKHRREGLVAFVQPTPGQLLALSEVSDWTAVAWDAADYKMLSQKVHDLVVRNQASIVQKAFLDSTKRWIKKHAADIGGVEFINPPETWSGFKRKAVDPTHGVLSIGAMESQSDWRLPIAGDADICELRFVSGKWKLKVLSLDYKIEFTGDAEYVRVGDQLKIEEHIFLVEREARIDEFLGIARKLSFIQNDESLFDENTDSLETELQVSDLESYLRSLLYEQKKGAILVKSGHKRGQIFVDAGLITHAVTGSVSGLKALLRVVLWAGSEWSFRSEAEHSPTFKLNLLSFTRHLSESKKIIDRVHAFLPPSSVRLRVVPKKFLEKLSWTPKEARVLAAVAEYALVRDVLNYCPLADAEIYETLIELRKSDLLRPAQVLRRDY